MAADDNRNLTTTATGGQILVDALKAQGVERVYCVPGESYLPVLDALYDCDIAVYNTRHEGSAANMAEAEGKLTGRPGICMVTRGPGATHASIGVHTAFQDSTPMILFIGQVARDARDREGFQEVDYRAMFGPLAKWAAEIDDAERIPEYISRAFHVAMSGRPGPVVLSLPEDMLSNAVAAPVQAPAAIASAAAPRSEDLKTLAELLAKAERPLLVVGGTGWTEAGTQALTAFAQANTLPIAASFRRQDLIDNRLDVYAGHLGLGVDPTLAERLQKADLVVSIGSRLGENTTSGYTLMTSPVSSQKLVHIYPDPNEIGRVYQPALGICCGLDEFAKSLAGLEVANKDKRAAWVAEAHAAYVRFSTPGKPAEKLVDMAKVVNWLSENLEDNTIIGNGAGNYTVWVHRYYRYKSPRTELAPTSGAMGYGFPAAIAAQLVHPEKQVVAFAGDGCFLMYPQELSAAVQHKANLITLIVNNGIYGTIRMHQEKRFPGRVVATDIANPDFVAMSQSFGAYAERIETFDDFPAAFKRAQQAGKPAVLELIVDTPQLTPAFRIPE
ncbi:MAG: thiamine pyrophosphate-binding protein [Asticcacaulis sp.]|uniref:thiamine pyrophosphate-binding protein n=1 Tax=Asticcacaulis sp. TaxID=1872648 RepID=UPI0039E24039